MNAGLLRVYVLNAALWVCLLLFSAASVARNQEAGEGDAGEGGDGDNSVKVLLDAGATKELHDDTTILRERQTDGDAAQRGLVIGTTRTWVGGAVQYDFYELDGIYTHGDEGENRQDSSMRRLEAILRTRLSDWGELKGQYDLDQNVIRDLYLRWVSERPDIPLTITVGNQKEPMGLDYLQGNKFGMAQERALPVEAFGPRRALGVRLHKAFRLTPEERRFSYWQDDAAYLTTSVGVFTEDIERSNDTDLAITGRVTAGRERADIGSHVGVSLSYREGEFDRISPRPETRYGDRIPLARPQANTQGIIGLEGIYGRGRFYLQSEIMATDYAGRVDGHGYGAYLQGSWFLTRDSRTYNSRWGILAPHKPAGAYSVSLFARVSHARGDDDINGWNAFRALTLGTDFYYRRLRASLNLFFGDAREEINGEDEGGGFNLRFQYIF